MAAGVNRPQKPWEHTGASSSPSLFKPPSRDYGGGYGSRYGDPGMGGPHGGYGPGLGPYNQGPDSFGPPAPPPNSWVSFLREMHSVMNFFGRVSLLVNENTLAFHMVMKALFQLCDGGGMLYGELAHFVLRLLGMKTKPKKGIVKAPKSNDNSWDGVWAENGREK